MKKLIDYISHLNTSTQSSCPKEAHQNLIGGVLPLLFLTVFSSCGMHIGGLDKAKMKIEGIPDELTLGPDFEKAAQICNEFYGKGTEEAAVCFSDYRNYYKIGLDFSSIDDYCARKYNQDQDVNDCFNDLTDLLDKISGDQNATN